MTRICRRAALHTVASLLSLLAPAVTQAAPYYVSWSQLYDDTDSTRAQTPSAITVDSHGNVFVTGSETVGNGTGLYVAKYDSLSGGLLWQRRINSGTTIFQTHAIAVDSQGDVVVTGSINAGDINFYTIKLKGVDGTNFWAVGPKVFNGANSGGDVAWKVICDNADNVIVTGESVGQNGMGNSTGLDWHTIKYDRDDGSELASDNYSQTTTNLDDIPTSLAVDSSNNIYVTGTVRTAANTTRLYVRKLQASNLTKLWDIVPINTGSGADDAEGGGTAIAVDSSNAVVVTSRARDNANHFGYFTVKYTSAGTEVWRATGPFSQDTFGTPYGTNSPNRTSRAQPIGVAIGLDNAPIVTGTLLDASGTAVIRTIKYTSGGFLGGADEFWDTPSIDNGLGVGNTLARAIVADGAGNAYVVGETTNSDGDTDVHVAKYDTQTGARIFFQTFNRSETNPSADKGVDLTVDRLGNIVALGTFIASKNGSPSAGINEFGTIKLNRLIAPTGDELPDFISGVADNATVAVASAPAVSDSGLLATKLTFKSGKKPSNAMFLESTASGGTLLTAVKGEPAPVGPGEPVVDWASFSDPVVSPNGGYAFAGKVTGPKTKANGVWVDFDGGGLNLALRQGSVVPGMTEKLVSVSNIAMENGSLVALVKVAAPAASNTALVRINSALTGNVLMRTGQTGLMVNGADHTVKSMTVFNPPKSEAGDGRYQGNSGVVVRVSTFQSTDKKVKATAIVSISNAGTPAVRFSTGQDSPVTDATYSNFSYPSSSTGTSDFSVKASLAGVPAANNSALIFSATGAAFNAYAQKGQPTNVAGLPAGISYADFSDPIVNTSNLVAFIATLKGSPADVKSTSNKAVIFGAPLGLMISVARTGDFATDSLGAESSFKWTAFTALANPGGENSGPIFVGKLNTKKNNLGLWARDTTGNVRLLLRQGDQLGDQTVRKFTVLNAVSKAMAAPRSFDAAGSVAVFISFTDGKTAIQRIGIP